MYWNILVWLRIEIPDGFLHQISENLKIDDLVTGGTINLQLTPLYVHYMHTCDSPEVLPLEDQVPVEASPQVRAGPDILEVVHTKTTVL